MEGYAASLIWQGNRTGKPRIVQPEIENAHVLKWCSAHVLER